MIYINFNKILDDKLYSELDQRIFYSHTLSGSTQTILTLNDNLVTHLKVYLNLYRIEDNKHLSELDFTIYKNKITIDYLYSWCEHNGNALKLLEHFKDVSDKIINSSCIDIRVIDGMLSFKDFDYWDKLIFFYSSIYPMKQFVLDNKYSKKEFEKVSDKYVDKSIKFQIFI